MMVSNEKYCSCSWGQMKHVFLKCLLNMYVPPLPLAAPRVDYLLFPRWSPASGPPSSAPFFCWRYARPLYLKPPSALPPRDPTSPIGFGAAAGRKEDNRRRTGINSESREGNLIVI